MVCPSFLLWVARSFMVIARGIRASARSNKGRTRAIFAFVRAIP